ncbi:MAG: recombinase RecA, partial [Thermoguttaceae bacterium]|nr:recombinase RecA [Thermoguttaceae bacterium]
MVKRLSTGIPGLDEKLGGGLLAGTTTAVVGGSGAGKTQFALQFLNAGF